MKKKIIIKYKNYTEIIHINYEKKKKYLKIIPINN